MSVGPWELVQSGFGLLGYCSVDMVWVWGGGNPKDLDGQET